MFNYSLRSKVAEEKIMHKALWARKKESRFLTLSYWKDKSEQQKWYFVEKRRKFYWLVEESGYG